MTALCKDLVNLKVSEIAIGGKFRAVHKPRVALWDQYGGSIESGWVRYMLERTGFDFTVVYPPDLDLGDLHSKFDVIIFPNGAIPRGDSQRGGGNDTRAEDLTIPFYLRARMGSVSAGTIAKLEEFAKDGGHIVTIGSSSLGIASRLKLPVRSALVDKDGTAYPNTKFYIPGSLMDLSLTEGDLTRGMGSHVDVMFENSPSFRIVDDKNGMAKAVGTYATANTLRSGWALGQELLEGTAGIVDVTVGKGKVVMFGPEIVYRAQPHGTYKLLMNAIFRSAN